MLKRLDSSWDADNLLQQGFEEVHEKFTDSTVVNRYVGPYFGPQPRMQI